MSYNEDLDTLLCFIDGKITAYRMKNHHNLDEYSILELMVIQKRIQLLWDANIQQKKQPLLNNASC